MEISSILIGGVMAATAFVGILGFMILQRLTENGDTAMVKMRLKQEETIKELRLLLLFHSIIVPALILVALSGVTGSKILIDSGRSLIVLQGVGVTAIFYKWWKRF